MGALAGPLGAFGGPMGLPHGGGGGGGPQSLIKAPQELHREDIKIPLGGPSAEERLVSWKDAVFVWALLLAKMVNIGDIVCINYFL